jgi:GT2 family glycosyltransferase
VCILVNWNGWRDTIVCLQALSSAEYSNLSTIVVDNGSVDDSVAEIRAERPNVRLIATGKNLGFSGGNNAGIHEAIRQSAEYVWLLNNDTIPAPNALKEMVQKAEADRQIGAVGSVLFYSASPDTVQDWGGGWVNVWMGHCSIACEQPKAGNGLDFLTGASMLVRTEVFSQLGLMDDRYFLYWEDVELCFRMRRHGWKLAVAPDALVLHKVNASTAKNRNVVDRFFTTSGLRFLAEYSPVPAVSVFCFLILRMLNRVAQGRVSRISEVCKGVEDYVASDRAAALPFAQ